MANEVLNDQVDEYKNLKKKVKVFFSRLKKK